MKIYDKKIIISGNIVEVYSYNQKQIKREVREPKIDSNGVSDEKLKEYSKKNGYKRKRRLRRLINSNSDVLDKFFTLTFKNNIKNLDFAYYELEKFKKRLKYYLDKNNIKKSFKYVVVVEFQKRGAVHFHMLCNLPFIKAKVLHKMWRNGFVKINKIDDVDNVGAYVVKYMGKTFDDSRLQGRKRYNRSRNLKEPEEVLDKKRVAEILSQLPSEKLIFDKKFNNEYVGDIHYQQYNLKRNSFGRE